jgi:hypothetical protein
VRIRVDLRCRKQQALFPASSQVFLIKHGRHVVRLDHFNVKKTGGLTRRGFLLTSVRKRMSSIPGPYTRTDGRA